MSIDTNVSFVQEDIERTRIYRYIYARALCMCVCHSKLKRVQRTCPCALTGRYSSEHRSESDETAFHDSLPL